MRRIINLLATLLLILSLTACGSGLVNTSQSSNGTQSIVVTAEDTSSQSAQDSPTTAEETQKTTTVQSATTNSSGTASSAETALAENSDTHDNVEDYDWESASAVQITLNGDAITSTGEGVTITGSTAIITSAGTYDLSGSLTDGQIIVDTTDEEIVRLVLNGVELHNSTSAPIYVKSAEKVLIVLADGAKNTVSDEANYVFEDPAEDEPNAAIFSTADLTVYGTGSLTVNANYNDGIASKDGLIIASGSLTVNAVDDGIRGKDYLVVKDGSITVNAQGDGLKSDNEEDADRGYIAIEGGVLNVITAGDAITAQTDVIILDGEITLSTGGGSNQQIDETVSAKGIKGLVNVIIAEGSFTIDTADDALHSNGSLVIDGGAFTITSGDDGLHADADLTINAGTIDITNSYEGIESSIITINNGDIRLTSTDDGINVAGGNDASAMNPGMGGNIPRPGGRPGNDASGMNPGTGGNMPRPGAEPGTDNFTDSGNDYLYLNGGSIVVNAAGDGIDVNGAIEMTGGNVIVNGPIENMNSALDYDASFKITGGFLVAVGSAGMAQAPGSTSSQASILVNLDSAQQAGTLFHLQTESGEEILTFTPAKQYQSIVFSSPELEQGTTYNIFLGGSSTGAVSDGLYEDGTYTPGNLYTSVTLTDITTMVGSSRGGWGPPARP